MSAIGENIRSIRREQKLTQLALAMRVGVTPQAVGKWERGESEPDISLLLPIAKALNVTAETLFGLENRRGSAPASFLAEEFPESLKCRRLAANLTQAELARKLDVRPQTVSKWENGVCAPDAGYLAALCSLYGISPSALLSERALPPQRAQAPAVPASPAPAAAECVKKPGFFSKRPVRAAALALFLVLALCIVLVPFSLGSSSPSLPGPSAQQPEDPAPPGGGTEEPENPGSGTDDPEEPGGGTEEPEDPGGGTEEPEEPENPGELPPPEITYYTLTLYSDVAPFPEENTVWQDELVQEGWTVSADGAEEKGDVCLPPFGADMYILTGYTYKDGTPVQFPLTMTRDTALYAQQQPAWLDWAAESSYTAQQAELALCRELDTAYIFLEGYIRFYGELCDLLARCPQAPRAELFRYLNDPGRDPVFPRTVQATVNGERMSLPLGDIPEPRSRYPEIFNSLPELTAFEEFCDKYIRQPCLQLTYAMTQENVPLESAVVSAIKNFAPFVSLGHESRTAAYRSFLEEHADAAAYAFPEISLAR